MSKRFFIFAVIAGIIGFGIFSVFTGHAGNDEDFNQASNTDNYPGLTNMQSAQLNINLASVIHQENLQIIKALQEIEGHLQKLDASIQKIEQQAAQK